MISGAKDGTPFEGEVLALRQRVADAQGAVGFGMPTTSPANARPRGAVLREEELRRG
jgi:hypothetical protein